MVGGIDAACILPPIGGADPHRMRRRILGRACRWARPHTHRLRIARYPRTVFRRSDSRPVEGRDIDGHIGFKQKRADHTRRHPQCPVLRIAVCAGGNQREGNRFAGVRLGQIPCGSRAGLQLFPFVAPSVDPSRSGRGDSMAAGQVVRPAMFAPPVSQPPTALHARSKPPRAARDRRRLQSHPPPFW